MLLRLQTLQRELLPRFQRRQLVLQLFVFLVLSILRFFVDFQEAVELHHRSCDPEPELVRAIFSINVYSCLVEHGGHHLRRQKALVDQLVDLEFVFLQVLLDVVRSAQYRRRTYGFVRFLRIFLGLKQVRAGWQIRCAKLLPNMFAHFR